MLHSLDESLLSISVFRNSPFFSLSGCVLRIDERLEEGPGGNLHSSWKPHFGSFQLKGQCALFPNFFLKESGKNKRKRKFILGPRGRANSTHSRWREEKAEIKGGETEKKKGISSASIAGLAAVPSTAQRWRTRRQTIAKIVSIWRYVSLEGLCGTPSYYYCTVHSE